MSAKDKLVIEYAKGAYYICWYLHDEQDLGGPLGDDEFSDESLAKTTDPDDREAITATLAVKPFAYERDPAYGYLFETEAQAKKALRAANAAIKAEREGRQMPEWAKKALSEGWKPPRGWKP